MLIFTLSSIALPCTAGFAGEFPLLVGVFQRGWAEPALAHASQLRAIAVLSVAGVVLGAWYMLWLYRCVFFGPARTPSMPVDDSGEASHSSDLAVSSEMLAPDAPADQPNSADRVGDLSLREVFCLAPLAAMILWIGLQPDLFFDRMRDTLDELTAPVREAYETEAYTKEPVAAGMAAMSRIDEPLPRSSTSSSPANDDLNDR